MTTQEKEEGVCVSIIECFWGQISNFAHVIWGQFVQLGPQFRKG